MAKKKAVAGELKGAAKSEPIKYCCAECGSRLCVRMPDHLLCVNRHRTPMPVVERFEAPVRGAAAKPEAQSWLPYSDPE